MTRVSLPLIHRFIRGNEPAHFARAGVSGKQRNLISGSGYRTAPKPNTKLLYLGSAAHYGPDIKIRRFHLYTPF